MITRTFEDRDSWLSARRGKITGSRLKDILVKRGTGKKLGFYELIAERIAIEPENDESAMDRGSRLESEAVARFVAETGKEVDTSLVIWEREDNQSIAISPDGFIGDREAVEAKCLSSAKHIQAFIEQKIPDEYYEQAVQYFVVNDKLKKLYFVFYDPRIPSKDYFVIEILREDILEDIEAYLKYEKDVIEEVNAAVLALTF